MENTFQKKCDIFSKRSAVFLSFVIPISTIATHIVLLALVMSWFLSGHLQEKTRYIFKHPVARIALLLFGLFLMGAAYSSASSENIAELLDKMSKLLYLPFLLPLMVEEEWRKKAIKAFVAAMLLTLILSILKVYGGLPISTRYTAACVFKDHIYTNLMMAFTSFVIGHYVLNLSKSKMKPVLWVFLISLIFYIFFMSEGRSGYIIFGLLWLLLGFQRYHLRGLCVGVLGVVLVLGLAFVSSERFQTRFLTAIQDVEQYWAGDANSSLGARLEYSYRTWKLAEERLWLGWGTGSFKEVYQQQDKEVLKTENPHNEYANILLQLGMVGLIAFLGFFWTIFRRSFNLPKPERWLAQGLLLAMAVGCFANSWLMDSTAGYFFIVLIACCFGALKVKDA
jgi:O-antigen ligase